MRTRVPVWEDACWTKKNPQQMRGPFGKLFTCVLSSSTCSWPCSRMLSDRVGADAVMIVSLTLCMAAGIVTIDEGLEGFSNEGLLSVMALFVVAQGISVTGALDWYMGKLLGTPTTEAGAQLRLMIPISIVSAFINNTPVVVVMIPIVKRSISKRGHFQYWIV